MNVRFFTNSEISIFNESFSSNVASARYRVIAPALHLSKCGVNISIRTIGSEDAELSLCVRDCIDVVILSKGAAFVSLDFIKRLKANNIYVIFDICDNYINHHVHGELYKSAFINTVKNCHKIISSTDRLSEVVYRETGVLSYVISDPSEFEIRDPSFNPSFFELTIIWFGHESNISPLINCLPDIVAFSGVIKIKLLIVTGVAKLQEINVIKNYISESFKIIFLEWSVEVLKDALTISDVVIIPSDAHEYFQSKSPNRLVESLMFGKLVVAQSVPSYKNLSGGYIECSKISEGLMASVSNIQKSRDRIAIGQSLVKLHNSKFVIGERWLNAINAKRKTTKLNLGCGDKYISGYINVDIVPSRKGVYPDLITNLNDLSMFMDNSIDEILSVHVVEHFWRWEIRAVLSEWYRKLKPGGRIVLECPNLLTACKLITEDPEVAVNEGVDGQRSMWVLYGDPSWHDPYMMHRWGYTPSSLISLLEELSFSNVKQEPAVYKLREPRDMRITGIK